jgi:polysaccharide biosynthesis/export protein
MSPRDLGKLTCALTATLLCACSVLPTSGPSRSQVADGRDAGIEIIDVTDAVAAELLTSRRQELFSDIFRNVPGTNEIIGPGDVLEVSVWEAPPAALFSTAAVGTVLPSVSNMTVLPQQMVSAEGTIYVPFAGRVVAAGKSLREIETAIARQLRDKANQPQVMARLVMNNTSYVTVVGEVEKSTRMPLTPRGEHVLDALAAAGGTKDPVEKMTLQITRGATASSLPLSAVIRDPRENVALQPGDVVTALYQPMSFTALGATGKSDEVNFEAQGISLAQALARAGGVVDARADAQGVFIFRFEAGDALHWPRPPSTTPEGKVPVIYRLNLEDPRSFFVAQSFRVENKDVLYVANSSGAQLQKFLNLLVSTVYPIQGAISLTK